MTNAQKYKTPKERMEAFAAFCRKQQLCEKCSMTTTLYPGPECTYRWLDFEAEEEEKPLPCPFCGGETQVIDCCIEPYVRCSKCGVHTNCYSNRSEVVAAWNRRVK